MATIKIKEDTLKGLKTVKEQKKYLTSYDSVLNFLLENLGIDWESYQEQYFNSAGQFKDVVLSIAAQNLMRTLILWNQMDMRNIGAQWYRGLR